MRIAICTTPRAGLHLLLDLLGQCGLSAGFWPDLEKQVVGIHGAQMHEVEALPPVRIHLIRRDVVAQAISWHIAACDGSWTKPRDGDVRFDRESIARGIERIDLDNASWRRMLGAGVVTLSYEDLVMDPRRAVRGLTDQVTLPKRLHPRTKVTRTSRNDEFRKLWDAG